MFQTVYSTLTYGAWPVLKLLGRYRTYKNKELSNRINERYGITSAPLSSKDTVWIHAASNGEALSAIAIINHFQSLPNPPHILMTTMTVTAANLIKQRVTSDNFTHQFIPYDHPKWINRFHKIWNIKMVIWIESELWPNHLKAITKKKIPAALLNARLSDRSVKRWALAKEWFNDITSCFDIILAQTARDAKNLESLGVSNVVTVGNLKDVSPALPYDNAAADDIRGVIEPRPTLLFASTHDPEEKLACDIHKDLKKLYPQLLSIIVPRHPVRGETIASALNIDDLNIARRSLKMSPRVNTDIYIADTLGELGLFYHLCPIVFIGNSLGTKPGGGHNLMEAAWHHCAIISGNDLHNFSTQAKEMPDQDACIIVNNAAQLADEFSKLLDSADIQATLSRNAYNYVTAKYNSGLTDILKAIEPTCQKADFV